MNGPAARLGPSLGTKIGVKTQARPAQQAVPLARLMTKRVSVMLPTKQRECQQLTPCGDLLLKRMGISGVEFPEWLSRVDRSRVSIFE
ncbi:hypothetical protein FOZ63_032860, partial [Perkinsus olseni]